LAPSRRRPAFAARRSSDLHDLPVADHRLLLDLVDAQDGHFGVVDDGRREDAAQGADVGDGKGAAPQVLQVDLALAGLLGQVLDLDRKSTRLNSSHVKSSYA